MEGEVGLVAFFLRPIAVDLCVPDNLLFFKARVEVEGDVTVWGIPTLDVHVKPRAKRTL